MPKPRISQAPKPSESGLPVFWYYMVTVVVVACLVILFAVMALSNYRDVILVAAGNQAIAQLEGGSRLVRDSLRETREEARLVQSFLERVAARQAQPAELARTDFWTTSLTEAGSLLLADYTAPAGLFLLAQPGGEGSPEAYLAAQPATDGAWTAEPAEPAAFWQGPFGELSREVMAKGEPLQTRVYRGPGEVPHALVTTLLPLRREGRVIGVLGVSTDIERLLAGIEGWRVGDRGGLMLLENASSIVLSRPLQGARTVSGFLAVDSRFSYNLLQNPRTTSAQEILSSTLSPTKVIGDDGDGYYVLSRSVGETGWSLIAYIPEEEVIAEFGTRSRGLLLFSLCLLAAVVTAIIVLNRMLSRPITQLLGAVARPIPRVDAESIAKLRAREDGPREIATLAAAYNRLLDTIMEEMHSKAEYAKRLESSHEHLSGFTKMLEKMVADRTRELERSKEAAETARENAERAQQYAEEANEAKSNFLANISHELRTPMNAILGYTELLMEEAEENHATETLPDLQKVHSAGKHLLTLIDDILDIAKIESGRMNLKFETFHVGDMLKEVIEATEPLTRNHLNRLFFTSGVGEVLMIADRIKVKQILLNLAGNACKFTDHGEIHVEAVCAVEDGWPCLVVEVRDTGIGMSEEQLSRIFEKFSQVDESSTRRHGGTGLGLYICRNFTELMGGYITVTSEPGFGSSFMLELPLDVPAALSARDQEAILEMERSIKEKAVEVG